MRRIEYPPENTGFKDSYLAVFAEKISGMENNWSILRNQYSSELAFVSPNVSDILLADYSVLSSWYIQFKQLSADRREAINQSLSVIFDYDGCSNGIASYFKDPKNGFHISTCHYCDLAYINVYEIDPDADAIYFLNNASDEELQKITKSAKRIEYIRSQRPYYSKRDYDKVADHLGWKPTKWARLFKPDYRFRHHFDLDHVLPKSEFPLAALSLYNFVPSCQICNQKLKKARVLGTKGVPKQKLSPSSPLFDFYGKTEFLIVPRKGVKVGSLQPTEKPQDYNLILSSIDPDYEEFIQLFKLQERYQQHKPFALHWLEMKTKYTDVRISMMASSLMHPSFDVTRIKSDIFQEELYRRGNMSLSKLREDILK